jgi:hypothetical protein
MDERSADGCLLIQYFRQIISLASLAYIFTTIHAIQYSMRDNTDDSNSTPAAPPLNPHDADSVYYSSASSSLHTFTQTATTSNTEGSEKTSGQWTTDEILLLLEYVRENCVLTTMKGLNLKKTEFNKAREVVKTKDVGQCQYKWGHVHSILLSMRILMTYHLS